MRKNCEIKLDWICQQKPSQWILSIKTAKFLNVKGRILQFLKTKEFINEDYGWFCWMALIRYFLIWIDIKSNQEKLPEISAILIFQKLHEKTYSSFRTFFLYWRYQSPSLLLFKSKCLSLSDNPFLQRFYPRIWRKNFADSL